MKLVCKLPVFTTWKEYKDVYIENIYIENECVDCSIDNSEVEDEKQ